VLSDNPNPGMGIRFIDLTLEARERLIDTVRTIAYVHASTTN
jgi:type IV pilus assembly protein PilZ